MFKVKKKYKLQLIFKNLKKNENNGFDNTNKPLTENNQYESGI